MTHALRGMVAAGRGDLTGARIAELSSRKTDHDIALANTRNALTSEPTEQIRVTGGRVFLLPAEAVAFIRAEAIKEAD